MKNEIFGISFDFEPKKIDNDFVEEVFDADESAVYISKDKFHLDDEECPFDYYYVIESNYLDNGQFIYILSIVPCIDSLEDRLKKELADFCGITIDEVNEFDATMYGCNIVLASESVMGEKVDKKILDLISSVVPTIDATLGFYLDRQVNSFNKSGFDVLKNFVKSQNA